MVRHKVEDGFGLVALGRLVQLTGERPIAFIEFIQVVSLLQNLLREAVVRPHAKALRQGCAQSFC